MVLVRVFQIIVKIIARTSLLIVLYGHSITKLIVIGGRLMPVPIVWGIAICLGAVAIKIIKSDDTEVEFGPFKAKTS